MIILKKKKYNLNINVSINSIGNFIKFKSLLGEYIWNFDKNFSLIKKIGFNKYIFIIKNLNIFIKKLKLIIYGLMYGWYLKLKVSGRGYYFYKNNNRLKIDLGFSHGFSLLNLKVFGISKVFYDFSKKKDHIFIYGINIWLLNNLLKKVKDLRPVDSYKGRGVRVGAEYFFLNLLYNSIDYKYKKKKIKENFILLNNFFFYFPIIKKKVIKK